MKITALTWDDDSARLFIGDERGIVTAVIVAPFKLVSVGSFIIMNLLCSILILYIYIP